MNRKLHNSLMAVIASSSLLTLGLIAGSPVMQSPNHPVTQSANASVDDVAVLQDDANGNRPSPAAAGRGPARAVRGNRQTVSMPFFSFVPRG